MIKFNLNKSIHPKSDLGVSISGDKISISNELNQNSLELGLEDSSLQEFLQIYNKKIEFLNLVESKIIKQLNCERPNLIQMFPKHALRAKLLEVSNTLNHVFNKFGSAYLDTFIENRRFTESLSGFTIESANFERFKFESGNEQHDLKDYLDKEIKVKYSLANTVTGRLTVKSGLNVLTLPKWIKKSVSSLKGKQIWELDLSALEPSTLFHYLNFSQELEKDFYDNINEKLFENKLDRESTKKIIISFSYGAGDLIIKNILSPFYDKKSNEKLRDIKNKLNFDQFSSSLEAELNSFGFIMNGFKRPIFPKEGHRSGTLINNFIQSTAADISLFVFKNLKKDFNIDPIFLIHDAIYFEADEFEIKKIKNEKFFLSGLENFYLKYKLRRINENDWFKTVGWA